MKKTVNLLDTKEWVASDPYLEGTLQKILRHDNGGKSILLKLPKGFRMASHSHLTTEQHVVLDGAYTSEGYVYSIGTYRLIPAHESHGPFESEEGTLILVIYDPGNTIMA